MTEILEPWEEPEYTRGMELSIEETNALWDFFQRDDCPPYWENPLIALIADKAKSFGKYGPWDPSDRA